MGKQTMLEQQSMRTAINVQTYQLCEADEKWWVGRSRVAPLTATMSSVS